MSLCHCGVDVFDDAHILDDGTEVCDLCCPVCSSGVLLLDAPDAITGHGDAPVVAPLDGGSLRTEPALGEHDARDRSSVLPAVVNELSTQGPTGTTGPDGDRSGQTVDGSSPVQGLGCSQAGGELAAAGSVQATLPPTLANDQ